MEVLSLFLGSPGLLIMSTGAALTVWGVFLMNSAKPRAPLAFALGQVVFMAGGLVGEWMRHQAGKQDVLTSLRGIESSDPFVSAMIRAEANLLEGLGSWPLAVSGVMFGLMLGTLLMVAVKLRSERNLSPAAEPVI